jgi:hypothetical protein
MEELNCNEILFLRWMKSDCDWDQIAFYSDHSDYGHIDPTYRTEHIQEEIEYAMMISKQEGVFDEEFLSKVCPVKLADVIFDNDENRYLNPTTPEKLPFRCFGIFSKSRIKGKLVLSTPYHAELLDASEEPGKEATAARVASVQCIAGAALNATNKETTNV